MAKRLTEEMVVARTKISDLGKIKRLNCWGSELVDVSLLRRMPCVEVLSLSINKINSLEDFQFCKRLEELYIRQNDIRDLNQICYLQCLPNLKNLWLGENPCASTDGTYRSAVLRALPQLQKLDNVAVSPEELKEAQRKGKPLTHPEDPVASDEEESVAFTPPPQAHHYSRYQDYPQEQQQQQQQEYSPQRSPSRQEAAVVQYQSEETEEYYARVEIKQEDPPPPYTNNSDEIARRTEPARRNYSPEQEYVERRRNSYERESPPQQQYYDRSPPPPNNAEEYNTQADTFRETKIVTSQSANITKRSSPPANNAEDYNNHADTYRETKIVTSQSANSIKEYTNGDRYSQQQVYRQTESETSYPQQETTSRRERHACPAPRPPFNRRPVTRNSNILSAVLCLVKELDYPSLEVVEMAVRCRMDELDE